VLGQTLQGSLALRWSRKLQLWAARHWWVLGAEGKETSLTGNTAEMGEQLCMVTPVLAESSGCHVPDCSPMVGLEVDVGVRSSPGNFLLVVNDLQSRSRKFWEIVPKLGSNRGVPMDPGGPLHCARAWCPASCLILSSLGGLALNKWLLAMTL